MVAGEYKIVNNIDTGSFGEVYLGVNIKTGVKVSIKLVLLINTKIGTNDCQISTINT